MFNSVNLYFYLLIKHFLHCIGRYSTSNTDEDVEPLKRLAVCITFWLPKINKNYMEKDIISKIKNALGFLKVANLNSAEVITFCNLIVINGIFS